MSRKKSSKPRQSSPYSDIAAALARRRAQVLTPERQHAIAMLGVTGRAKKRRERERAAAK